MMMILSGSHWHRSNLNTVEPWQGPWQGGVSINIVVMILADHHDHDLPAGESHLRLLQLQLCLVRMVRVGSLLSIMQCGHSGQYLHKTTPTWNWTLRYARGRSCRARLVVQQGRRRRENAVQGIALETVGGVHGAPGTLAQ